MTPVKRKSLQKEPVSQEQSFLNSFYTFAKTVEQRLRRLEEEVFDIDNADWLSKPQAAKGPGRKQAMPLKELLKRRDSLIYFVEDNWPELRPAITKAISKGTPDLLKPAIQTAVGKNYPFQPEFVGQWEQHIPDLWEFFHCKKHRYFNNPRNIANAMAGVPHMRWKTSFDKCSENPSQLGIYDPALPDYLRRKVFDRYCALKKAKNVEQVKAILDKRSRDRHIVALRSHPERVLRLLKGDILR